MSFIDEHGTPDTNEFYNVSKDDMTGQHGSRLRHPQVIEDNRPLFQSFIVHCHQITTLLLRELSTALKLEPIGTTSQHSGDVLPELHRLTAASEDQVSMIKYPVLESMPCSQPIASHTDYGSITILFSSGPGLQVLKKSSLDSQAQWCDIPPLEGHAIVNCGDALSILSGGIISSSVHRVTSHASRGSSTPRYSLGYFARPENDQILRTLRGPLVKTPREEREEAVRTKDWILRRSYGRLLDKYQGEKTWAATAGTENL